MQKTFTQFNEDLKEREKVVYKPKKSSVEFIKQFARAYKAISIQPASLSGFVAN